MDELRLGEGPEARANRSQERVRLLRPLLDVPRAEIEAYCRDHDLHPRYDRSNADTTYYRNRLRHELIPLLESYNPRLRRILRRTAHVMAGDWELLRGLLIDSWPTVVRSESERAVVYDLDALRALPLGLRRSILREGIHRLRFSLRNIDYVHVEDALRVLQTGAVGAMATLPRGLVLTIGYDQATLASEGYEPPLADWPRVEQPLSLPVPGHVDLPDSDWAVTTKIVERRDLPEDWRHNPDRYRAYMDAEQRSQPLVLRPRREGDWLIPLGLDHRQTVRDFMINAKIPRRERATVPLLVCGQAVSARHGAIAWIVGWRLDARYGITPSTRKVLVVSLEQG
jgi:tRNA(Ile)-lysidine synthase